MEYIAHRFSRDTMNEHPIEKRSSSVGVFWNLVRLKFVLHLQMSLEVGLARELPITKVTNELANVQVSLSVSLPVLLPQEATRAHVARIRPILLMDAHVHLEIAACGERLLAQRTLEKGLGVIIETGAWCAGSWGVCDRRRR